MSKISVVRCNSYETPVVEKAVRKAIDSLGGIERFVKKGETILLKPNMLRPRNPEEAITTHPEIVRAMIRLVKDAGSIPIVGDSPSGRSNEKILRRLAEKTGIGKICEEENVEFVFFIDSMNVSFPEGIVAKSFELTTYLNKVDGIISLAKMKTHAFTGLTGGVKNNFGLIPGSKKSDYHSKMKSLEMFSEFLIDLVECIKPKLRLSAIDAIVGMEGDGPVTGKARNFDRIMASDNPHELDSFLARIMGAEPGSIQTIKAAKRRNLIADNIDIVGDLSMAVKIEDFKMPSEPKILDRILEVLGIYLGDRQPVFLDSCILCGSCIDMCPGDALKSRKGRKKPIVDYKNCIKCYCCQEVCDNNAIILKHMFIRSVGRGIIANIKKQIQNI